MHLPFAKALKSAKPVAKASLCHLPIRFSELANTPHSPMANERRMHLPFAEANGKACGECAAFAREEGASYCKKSKPTTVKDSITLVTGGGSKTDIGASAPVLPPPSFSTRQVFILTNNFK